MRALEDRKDLRIGSKLRTLCEEAGLVEVDAKMIPLPLSAWSSGKFPLAVLRCDWDTNADCNTDPRMREIGRYNSENIRQLLRSIALYPLTQRLHMSTQSFDRLVEQAQEEARNHSLKAYFPL